MDESSVSNVRVHEEQPLKLCQAFEVHQSDVSHLGIIELQFAQTGQLSHVQKTGVSDSRLVDRQLLEFVQPPGNRSHAGTQFSIN